MTTKLIALLKTLNAHPVIDPSIPYKDYSPLDLSISNVVLQSYDVSTPQGIQAYINLHLDNNSAQLAYGGYLEQRDIYSRSQYFNKANSKDQRNIHLGLDLWIAAETSVHSPLDAEVHSFKNNTNYGDYGPTIILKHVENDLEFYTLYGHLSLASLKDLHIGKIFKQGDTIATLGDATVNGDYAPHLHFQIIEDLQDKSGDYPGVCSSNEVNFYKSNCPDPGILLFG